MTSNHILNAAASLLGVALIIVSAVHITGKAATSVSDEMSFAAALLFIGSCLTSHRAITKSDERFERFADKLFALGLVVLTGGVLSFWF
jgi:hypothetical protein